MKVSFKVGDKVRVKPDVLVPKYRWGSVTHADIGVVTFVGKEDMQVDFPNRKGWSAHAPEMELVVDAKRKSPEKVLAYGVICPEGELLAVTEDRDMARATKAAMGGKKLGVTIVKLQAGEEIR